MSLHLLSIASAAMKMPHWVIETTLCRSHDLVDRGLCQKPTMKYERSLDVQPGFQWDDVREQPAGPQF